MYTVVIEVRGRLDADWSDWMDGLEINYLGAHGTQLTGQLPDQSAVYAVLSRLAALNLELIAVRCTASEPQATRNHHVLRNKGAEPWGSDAE